MGRKWNLKSRIIASTRKIWYYSPLRKEIAKRAKVGKYFRCEKCKGLVEKVQIDHIHPFIDIKKGWEGYDIFVERLFCSPRNLQAICSLCHHKKTAGEQKLRRKYKEKK